jgi:hypothetical protein
MQNANLKLHIAKFLSFFSPAYGARRICIFHFEIYNFQYESFLCLIALNFF